MPQPLRYRGYVYDRELTGRGEASGWYWLGVRSYDPNIGRFIQPDPSEQEGTRSYVYCGDAPLDCSDPSGLLSLEDVGSWAHNTAYNAAQGAAGGLDFLSFGAYAHVAGAFGARVDTGSTAYQVGYWGTGAFLVVKGAVSLGAKVLARDAAAGSLRADADLLLPKLGPAEISHPEEYQAIMTDLGSAGVDIRYQPGALAYSPDLGGPGRLILDPETSIGALRHEYRHFLDVRDAGYPGYSRYLRDPAEYWRLEFRGYMEELRTARSIRDYDIGRGIVQQMRARRAGIIGS